MWYRVLKNEDVPPTGGCCAKNKQTNWRINKYGNEDDIISSYTTDTSSSSSSSISSRGNNNNTVYSRTLRTLSTLLEACMSQILRLNNMKYFSYAFSDSCHLHSERWQKNV